MGVCVLFQYLIPHKYHYKYEWQGFVLVFDTANELLVRPIFLVNNINSYLWVQIGNVYEVFSGPPECLTGHDMVWWLCVYTAGIYSWWVHKDDGSVFLRIMVL